MGEVLENPENKIEKKIMRNKEDRNEARESFCEKLSSWDFRRY